MTRSRDVADTQDNLGGAVAPFVAGKNAVINGGFDVWQRGTSFAVPTNYNSYTADRFVAYRSGLNTGATISRQLTNDTTNLPNIQYCLRYQRDSGNTATGDLALLNGCETANSIQFAGKVVSFSFYARAGANYSATSNLLQLRVDSGTGTDQNIGTGYTGQATLISASATLTTTWQRFTFTGTVPATAKEIGWYVFESPTGTAGANDYYEITGVQLELGAVATPFARAGGSIGGELALCQRYFTRYGASAAYIPFGTGFCFNSTGVQWTLPFKVRMRTNPTMSAAAGNTFATYTSGGAVTTGTSMTLDRVGDDCAMLSLTVASGLTAGQAAIIITNGPSAAFIDASAEL
jgi:hypothetical protein